MGNVYVFNLAAQPIVSLMINNRLVTGVPIPGWSIATATKYQPTAIPVPRSPLLAKENPSAAFSQATPNAVFVQWDGDQLETGFTVDMRGDIAQPDPSILEDYLLYIAATQAILFNAFGTTEKVYTPA